MSSILNEETKKLNLEYRNNFELNGLNCKEFYYETNLTNNIKDLNFSELDSKKINHVYVNKDKWYWQVWILETEESTYMFEEVIIS